MTRVLLISLGAILGANARYFIADWAGNRWGVAFPYGTLIANVSGSLLLGFVVGLSSGRIGLAPEARLLVAVGFLGSYTTFSSYTVDSLNLVAAGHLWSGVANIVLNNGMGLIAALLGILIARALG
jgi:CrcB protein